MLKKYQSNLVMKYWCAQGSNKSSSFAVSAHLKHSQKVDKTHNFGKKSTIQGTLRLSNYGLINDTV